MKLTKSLLLASAAGLAAVATASAADLPSKKAAPVEYVKVCSAYGPGFYYIPGTQTCIRVGGYAEFQAYGINKYTQNTVGTGGNGQATAAGKTRGLTDTVNDHAEARIFLDARDNTEFGLLRTFARLTWIRSSGSDDNSGSQPRRAQYFSGSGSYSAVQTGFSTAEAYIQLGGALVGRTTSFASVGAPSLQYTTMQPSSGRVNQIAYTASLGNGMSLSAVVEDAAELREGTFVSNYTAANQTYNGVTYTNGNGGTSYDVTTPANNMPDGVVSFDVAQSWGTVKLAGVLHQVYVPGYTSDNSLNSDLGRSSKTGFAGMSQVKINLPMIAAGDYATVYGAYANGALGRTIGNVATDTANSALSAVGVGGNNSFGLGDARWAGYDATVNTTTGLVKLSTSFSLGGEFKHYFTPSVAAYLGGTYGAIRYGSGKQSSSISEFAPHDANMWGVALGAVWSPVSGLEINPEVAYRKSNISGGNGVVDGNKQGVKNDDQYIGRIRVARSF